MCGAIRYLILLNLPSFSFTTVNAPPHCSLLDEFVYCLTNRVGDIKLMHRSDVYRFTNDKYGEYFRIRNPL
jgi:hypothetical protein